MTSTPRTSAAASTGSTWESDKPNGFSTRTCLPASTTWSASRQCSECGEATYTMSTAGSSSSARSEPWARCAPCSRANWSARACDRELTATRLAPSTRRSAWAKVLAMPPVPQIAHPT